MSTPDPVVALARSVDRATRAVEKVETALGEQKETVAGLAEQTATDHQQLVEIASTVAEMAPAVAEQGHKIEQIFPVVADLHQKVAALKPKRTPAAAPVSWLLVEDPDQAATILRDLADWLTRVYLRFPAAELPTCWAWHPDLIEELLVLREAHRAAYEGDTASWKAAADWHDRLRPHVLSRINETRGTCDLVMHEPDQTQARPAATTPLPGVLDDVARHWTTHRAQPTPSPKELDEAGQYLRTEFAR